MLFFDDGLKPALVETEVEDEFHPTSIYPATHTLSSHA